ncbi:MAG: hypothetical protein ACR2NM_00280 [Bythopirellula sp.]
MLLRKLSWIVTLCQVLGLAAIASASPVVTITDAFGTLPDESFFAANPTAIVNVEDDGLISPGHLSDPFDFNGATVNINNRGGVGWHTLHPFLDDVSLNLYEGGVAHDRATFSGTTGSTNVTVHDGWARGRLTMQGNSVLNVNGGTVGGGQPHGAPALVAEGDSQVTISDGDVEHYVLVKGSADLEIAGGTVGDFLAVEESGHLTISGGSVGRLTHIRSAAATVAITGGTIDREFMATDGATVNMSAGAIGTNSLVRESVMNMSGGALGTGFKVYDGTLNMSGGTFGDNFRLGAFTGLPGTLNLFVKSATIDGGLIDLAVGDTYEVTRRDDVFLTAELINGGSVGLILNSDISNSIDYLRADSTLNLIRQAAPGDFDLDGDTDDDDLASWRSDYGSSSPGASFLAWQRNYAPATTPLVASVAAVPEPASVQMIVTIVAAIVGRRSRRSDAAA